MGKNEQTPGNSNGEHETDNREKALVRSLIEQLKVVKGEFGLEFSIPDCSIVEDFFQGDISKITEAFINDEMLEVLGVGLSRGSHYAVVETYSGTNIDTQAIFEIDQETFRGINLHAKDFDPDTYQRVSTFRDSVGPSETEGNEVLSILPVMTIKYFLVDNNLVELRRIGGTLGIICYQGWNQNDTVEVAPVIRDQKNRHIGGYFKKKDDGFELEALSLTEVNLFGIRNERIRVGKERQNGVREVRHESDNGLIKEIRIHRLPDSVTENGDPLPSRHTVHTVFTVERENGVYRQSLYRVIEGVELEKASSSDLEIDLFHQDAVYSAFLNYDETIWPRDLHQSFVVDGSELLFRSIMNFDPNNPWIKAWFNDRSLDYTSETKVVFGAIFVEEKSQEKLQRIVAVIDPKGFLADWWYLED